MSKQYSSRRRRRDSRRYRFRFARLESLESRLLLDGSGSLFDSSNALGNNAAEVHTVINLAARQVVRSNFAAAGRATLVAASSDFVADGVGVEEGFVVTLNLQSVELSGTFDTTLEESGRSFLRFAYQTPVSAAAGTNTFVANLTVSEAELADPVVIDTGESVEIGFLPPAPVSAASSVAAVGDLPPMGPKDHNAPASSHSTALAQASKSGQPSDGIAQRNNSESAPTQAELSTDQYFAGYAPRSSVALSTQSAAAQGRQHATAAVSHVARQEQTNSERTRLISLRSPFVTNSSSQAVSESLSIYRRDFVAAASRAAESAQAESVEPTPSNRAVTSASPPSSLDHDLPGNVMIRGYRRLQDLARSLYEPAALLVGVSLVSAHISTEADGNRKKQSRALRQR